MTLEIGNTNLSLLPTHGVFLEKSAVLVVSDVHLGKSATFRSQGIPIPEGDSRYDLDQLSNLIESLHPQQLVIAGDLFHAKGGMSPHVLDVFRDWAAAIPTPVILTEGNHDHMAGLSDYKLPIEIVPFLDIDGLRITHDPDDLSKGMPGIAGHLHPGIRVPESSRRSVRVPFFCLRNFHHLILPAFSRFTGLNLIELKPDDRIFVPVNKQVMEIPSPASAR